MIKANELRIGNWVSKGNEWYVTDFITIKMAHNYEPIPLTPEILEGCGFENDDVLHWKEYSIDGTVNYLSLTCGAYHWIYTNQLSEIDNYPRRKIQYLHQLQNLYFALTGEELKVNFHVEAAN